MPVVPATQKAETRKGPVESSSTCLVHTRCSSPKRQSIQSHLSSFLRQHCTGDPCHGVPRQHCTGDPCHPMASAAVLSRLTSAHHSVWGSGNRSIISGLYLTNVLMAVGTQENTTKFPHGNRGRWADELNPNGKDLTLNTWCNVKKTINKALLQSQRNYTKR